MLVIREAQMRALAEANWRAFENMACRHCWECHPVPCEAIGEDGVWSYVWTGLSKARAYGFEKAPDLLLFLSLMLTAGPDFDETAWAQEILRDPEYSPSVRAWYLRDEAMRQLNGLEEPPAEGTAQTSGAAAAEAASEPKAPENGWPEWPPEPVPPPVVLEPPQESCLPFTIPEFLRQDPHYDW